MGASAGSIAPATFESARQSGSSGRDDGNGDLAAIVAGFGTARVTMRRHTDVAHDDGSHRADLVKNAEPGLGQSPCQTNLTAQPHTGTAGR